MRTMRWRVRTLLGLVLVVALGIKGVLLFQPRPGVAWRGEFALMRLMELRPRPAFLEPALVADLDEPDAGVRHTAVRALDRIGSTSPALVRALVAQLEAETKESCWRNRWDSPQVHPAEALKWIKLPASVIAPTLRKAMASNNSWARLQATEVLCEAAGRPGPPSPILTSLLLVALQDKEAEIRMRAPEALACLDGDARRRAVAVLLDQLRGGDLPAKFLAVVGLSRFGAEGRTGVALLGGRLQGGDVATRVSNLYLLGWLGPVASPAVPAIVRAMTSPDAGRRVPHFPGCYVPRQNVSLSEEVGRLLQSGGSWPWPPSLCSVGASVLGRIGPDAEWQAIEILAGMLRGVDVSRRLGAVDALGALGPRASAAIPALLEVAERTTSARPGSDADRTMFRIMKALEKVGTGDDPRLVAALVRMLKSGDPTKRWGGAWVLNELKPPAVPAAPALVEALKDETQAVRFDASLALGRYGGPEFEAAVPALLDALEDEDVWVLIHAATSLARHQVGAGRAVPTLVPLLRSKNPSVWYHAAEALGAFGPAAGPSIPALREARNDAEEVVRDEAEEVLKAVAPAEPASSVE